MWTVVPQLRHLPAAAAIPEDVALMVFPLLFMAVGLALMIWARESMLKTAINRFLAAFVGIMLFSQMLFGWAAITLHLEASVIYRLCFIFWALAAATVGLIAQWRMFIPAFTYVAAFFVLLRFPEYRFTASSICHGITTLVAFFIWTPSIGAGKVIEKLDPHRNDPMATYRISRDVFRDDKK